MVLKVGTLLLILSLNLMLHSDIVDCRMMVDGHAERFIAPKFTNESYSDITGVKVKKVKRVNIVKGTAVFFQGWDNNCEAEVISYKMQGNEYRLSPYKVKRGKFCDLVMSETVASEVRKIFEGFNAPYECPMKPGNYTGEYEFDFSMIPAFMDGRWKVIVKIYLPNGFVESYEAYAEVHHYSA